MAAETPGGNRHQRRLSRADDRSTDKYYKSADKSVIAPGGAYAPGTEPQGNPTNRPRRDERSADKKYYAAPAQAPTPEQLARDAARARGAAVRRAVGRPARPEPATHGAALQVNEAADVPHVLGHVKDQLRDGPVTVTAAGTELLHRLRAAVELAVSRGELSEDQGRDVHYSLRPQAVDLLGPPRPRPGPTVRLSDAAADVSLDVDAVLAGTQRLDDDVPPVSTLPTAVTAVDSEGRPLAVEDNDFLAGGPAAAASIDDALAGPPAG